MKIKKKIYIKPQLRIIELKAEEVMVAGCKMLGRTAPGGVTCFSNRCAGTGS
ncbi:MAG: hypothetical protein HZB33_05185 [Nitrospirae bacterium]|nr:hypothetical protein [Nitrospirota bacterium]